VADQPLEYDVAVLGGGPGGIAAALRAASRGANTCLIEAKRLGGACLNVGCVSTKAMLAASGLFWRLRHAEQFGICAAAPTVDGRAFMKRPAEVVQTLRAGLEKNIASRKNLELIRGRGRLAGPDAVTIRTAEDEKRIRAGSIVIATGSRPIRPDFLPWASPRVMTSDEAVAAIDLPESVIVIGGGALGCEFATVYSELGIRTHLVEMLETLLPGLDRDAAAAVTELLMERGAELLTGRKVVGMKATADGVTAQLDDGRILEAACALVAVGRQADIEDIGLAEAGVHVTDGIIPVDERCRTNVENVYAVGDVAEKRQYAHLAERMGVVAAENATGHDLCDDRAVVPSGVYTHPEVAWVGLNECEARERFGSVRVLRCSYRNSPAALAYGQTGGQVKILVDSETGRIRGASWIGPHAVDMIHELALAMRQEITIEQIYHTVHAHPTLQEAVRAAANHWMAPATGRD